MTHCDIQGLMCNNLVHMSTVYPQEYTCVKKLYYIFMLVCTTITAELAELNKRYQ